MSIELNLFRNDLHTLAHHAGGADHPLLKLYQEVNQMDDTQLEANLKQIGKRLSDLVTPDLLQQNQAICAVWRNFLHHFPDFDQPLHFTGQNSGVNLNRPLIMADSSTIGNAVRSGMKEATEGYTADDYDAEVIDILKELNQTGQTGLINLNNVMKMVAIAEHLDSKELRRACKHFLDLVIMRRAPISTESFQDIVDQAKLLHSSILFEFCFNAFNTLTTTEQAHLLQNKNTRSLIHFQQVMQSCEGRFTEDGKIKIRANPLQFGFDSRLLLLNAEFPVTELEVFGDGPIELSLYQQIATLNQLENFSWSRRVEPELLDCLKDLPLQKIHFSQVGEADRQKHIQHFLQEMPSIKEISFPTSDESIPLLKATLEGNKSQNYIIINDNEAKTTIPKLKEAIQKNRQLEKVTLNCVDSSCIADVVNALKGHPNIREIDIEYLDEDAIMALMEILPTLPLLQSINIFGGNYREESLKQIFGILATLPRLEDLILSYLNVNGNAAEALLPLSNCRQLSNLWLSNLYLTTGNALGEIIKNLGNLEKLSIRNVTFSESDAKEFALAIGQVHRLMSLNLDKIDLGSSMLTCCESLSQLTQLQELIIDSWACDEEVSKQFAELLHLPYLTTVELPKLTFTPPMMDRMNDAIARHSSLTSLKWEGGNFDDTYMPSLCRAITANQSLTTLEASGDDKFTDMAFGPLLEILPHHPKLRNIKLLVQMDIDSKYPNTIKVFLSEHPEYKIFLGYFDL